MQYRLSMTSFVVMVY